MVKANIKLNNGASIPAGTAVVTVSEFNPDAPSICFFPPQEHPPDEATRMCNISYHLPGAEVSTARVRETYLMLIQQGWNYAPAPSAQQPPQPQAPPQPPSPAQATVSLRVAQNLTLRTAPDAHSEKVIVGPPLNDAIPGGCHGGTSLY